MTRHELRMTNRSSSGAAMWSGVRADLALLLLFLKIVGKHQVNQPPVDVGFLDTHIDPVAEPVDLSSLSSDDAVILFVEFVEVIRHVCHADHSFAFRLNDLDIDTPFSNSGYKSLILFLLSVGHEFHLLILDGCALCVRGAFFTLRRMFAALFVVGF